MIKIMNTKSIYYNDVNLIAKPSAINSRSEVPKELHRIIVAPMEAVVGETFAIEANRLGISVCLHRFCTPEKQVELYNKLGNKDLVFVSIGANDWERVDVLKEAGVTNWLIDIANGYIPMLSKSIEKLCETADVDKLMVGNVMTDEGFYNLCHQEFNDPKTQAKFDNAKLYVRIGIAGGSACATSDVTGYNRGQVTEIAEVSVQKNHMISWSGYNIVADGGIKNGNYAAKAFGAGADYVLMGGYFAKALEAETHVIGDGTYWGGASTKQQQRYGGIKKHSEGKVYKIEEELKPLSILIDDLWGGLSSAISYSGYSSITDFIGNATFEVKQNSLPPKR